jgi:hypothetical protein
MQEKKTKLFVDRTDGAVNRDERNGASPSRCPLEADVARNVLDMLGTPPRLYRVVLRQVSDLKYRANVFVGAGAGIFRVAHSFFLEVDTEGKVVESSPAISRMYGHQVG